MQDVDRSVGFGSQACRRTQAANGLRLITLEEWRFLGACAVDHGRGEKLVVSTDVDDMPQRHTAGFSTSIGQSVVGVRRCHKVTRIRNHAKAFSWSLPLQSLKHFVMKVD